jgi:hypothetical protein
MRKITVGLLIMAFLGLVVSAGWQAGLLPQSVMALWPGATPESPATQRAASDRAAKAAAQVRDADEETVETLPAEEEAPAAQEEATWTPASTPVALFGGGVLYFCHDIEITQSKSPSEDVAAALAYPDQSDWAAVGLLAVADVHWPAASKDLADLNALANSVLQQQDTLCQTYRDIWDLEALAAVIPTENTYLTGMARFVADAVDPQWVVRIGIIEED